MPLPTLEKTWVFSVNNPAPAEGSINDASASAAAAIVAAIIATGWDVKGSSNGTAGAMDGVNRVLAYTDWHAGTSDTAARSWVCFRHPTSGLEVLIEGRSGTSTNADRNWRVGVSPGGVYTGGAHNARPTATDEIVLTGATGDTFVLSTHAAHVVHVLSSSDGTQLRVIVLANGASTGALIVGVAGDALATVTGGVIAAAVTSLTWATLGNGSPFKALANGATVLLYFASLGWSSGSMAPSADTARLPQVDGNWLIVGGGFVSITAGALGVYGRPVDFWYGPSVRPMGSTYPADGSATFAQFDQLVVPWNGTVPLVA